MAKITWESLRNHIIDSPCHGIHLVRENKHWSPCFFTAKTQAPAVTKGCLLEDDRVPRTSTHWMGLKTTPSNVTPDISLWSLWLTLRPRCTSCLDGLGITSRFHATQHWDGARTVLRVGDAHATDARPSTGHHELPRGVDGSTVRRDGGKASRPAVRAPTRPRWGRRDRDGRGRRPGRKRGGEAVFGVRKRSMHPNPKHSMGPLFKHLSQCIYNINI